MSDTLTLKDLQNHLVKAIIGSVITTVILVTLAGIAFYYNTNSSISDLNITTAKLSITVDKHTEQINNTNMGMGMNSVQQIAFEKRLNGIEDGQKEILRLLIEIKKSQ